MIRIRPTAICAGCRAPSGSRFYIVSSLRSPCGRTKEGAHRPLASTRSAVPSRDPPDGPKNSRRGSYGVLRWGWCPAAVPGSYDIYGSALSAGAVIFFCQKLVFFAIWVPTSYTLSVVKEVGSLGTQGPGLDHHLTPVSAPTARSVHPGTPPWCSLQTTVSDAYVGSHNIDSEPRTRKGWRG